MAALPVNSADLVLANANAGKPRYNSMTDWAGGVVGDDAGRPDVVAGMPFSTATVALARQDGSAPAADYTPRSQNAKLAGGNLGSISGSGSLTAPVAAPDILRDRGGIAPNQRYPIAGDAALAAPVVTSIAPTTAAAAALPTTITITGTGFTPFSHVHTGGQGNAARSEKYVDATHMQVTIYPPTAPGTVSISVEDHSVLSNTDKLFTVT